MDLKKRKIDFHSASGSPIPLPSEDSFTKAQNIFNDGHVQKSQDKKPFRPPFKRKHKKTLVSLANSGNFVFLVPQEAESFCFDSFGYSDAHQYLLETGALDISLEWTKNHYRWIVHKLHWMSMAFGEQCNNNGVFFTKTGVLKQLQYRYQKEIVQTQRSIVRKIVERDYPPQIRMCLRVVFIRGDLLELNDGWYSIHAKLDQVLVDAVQKKRICIGTKLLMQGISLSSVATDGVPVLDALKTKGLWLLLTANRTRIGKLHTKLGLHKLGPLKIGINGLSEKGGVVSRMYIRVDKIESIEYMETLKDGRKIFRTEKQEMQAEFDIRKGISDEELALMTDEDLLKYTRDVTPMCRVSCFCILSSLRTRITIWRPCEDLFFLVKPNGFYSVDNLAVSKYNDIQLSSTSKTLWKKLPTGTISGTIIKLSGSFISLIDEKEVVHCFKCPEMFNVGEFLQISNLVIYPLILWTKDTKFERTSGKLIFDADWDSFFE